MTPTFKYATVHCIPKVTTPKTELDFRPTDILNLDYKIQTRILASRLSSLLSSLIMETQSGFVPGRSIHDTIDLPLLAKNLYKTGKIPRQALVMLLDFSKSCDSLDRDFLYAALKWHGFPPAFTTTIRALHIGTTAQFRANGYLSEAIEMGTEYVRVVH